MGQGTRTRFLTAAVLLSVFGAGVLLGLAADSNLVATPAAALVEGPVEVVEEDKEEGRSYMWEQVGPDSAQTVRIDSIVIEHRARMDALHAEFQANYDPRYREIVEGTREAIKEVFTEEQAVRYQEILDRRDRERAAEEAEEPAEDPGRA